MAERTLNEGETLMPEPTTCPTCGSAVKVHESDDYEYTTISAIGTTVCYEPVRLSEDREAVERMVNSLHSQDSGTTEAFYAGNYEAERVVMCAALRAAEGRPEDG
jgi:hypothetical protein